MYKLILSRASSKFLRTLSAKQFRQIVLTVLDLSKNPKPHDIRPLKGHSGFYRKDVGEYRIIFRTDKDTVNIVLLGKRNDGEIYRRFENLNL